MAVPGLNKRAMVRDRQSAIPGLSVRVTLLTSSTPTPSMSDTDPFSSRPTEAPTKATVHAVFMETRSQDDNTDAVGNVRIRKGYVEYHKIYSARFNAAQACIISGQPGRWRITGTEPILGGTTEKAYVTSQD